MNLAGPRSGRLCAALGGSGRRRLAALGGSGRLWAAMGSSGRLWATLKLDAFLRVLAALASFGRLWAALEGCGRLRAALSPQRLLMRLCLGLWRSSSAGVALEKGQAEGAMVAPIRGPASFLFDYSALRRQTGVHVQGLPGPHAHSSLRGCVCVCVCVCVCMCYMHTCMHACIQHTYVHTCICVRAGRFCGWSRGRQERT